MSHDLRARARERALLVRPDDPAAWLVVARERERAGERAEALIAAAEALRRAPRDEGALEALRELEWSGPWPAEDGDQSGASRSPLPGPREGLVVWRRELPQQLFGRPRIDRRGRVVVRGITSGLYRVDCEGRAVEPLGEWPPNVPPVLAGEEPGALDPSTHLFRTAGWEPGRAGLTARDPTGEAWVAWRAALLALDPEGLPRWRVELPSGVGAVRAGARGPVWATCLASVHEHSLLALRREDGRVAAERVVRDQRALLCTPEGGACVASGEGVLALGPDGAERWRAPLGPATALALGPELLLAATRAGLVALDPLSGQERWRRPALRAALPPAIDADGAAVLVTLEGRVVGLDREGERRFELAVDRRGVLGAPALGPQRAYLTAGRWLLAIR